MDLVVVGGCYLRLFWGVSCSEACLCHKLIIRAIATLDAPEHIFLCQRKVRARESKRMRFVTPSVEY